MFILIFKITISLYSLNINLTLNLLHNKLILCSPKDTAMTMPCTLRNHPNRLHIVFVLIISSVYAIISVYYAFNNLAEQNETKAFPKEPKKQLVPK